MNAELEITVIDVQGNAVKRFLKAYYEKGQHRLLWNGTNDVGTAVIRGIYFIEWSSSHFRQFTKAVLIR